MRSKLCRSRGSRMMLILSILVSMCWIAGMGCTRRRSERYVRVCGSESGGVLFSLRRMTRNLAYGVGRSFIGSTEGRKYTALIRRSSSRKEGVHYRDRVVGSIFSAIGAFACRGMERKWERCRMHEINILFAYLSGCLSATFQVMSSFSGSFRHSCVLNNMRQARFCCITSRRLGDQLGVDT